MVGLPRPITLPDQSVVRVRRPQSVRHTAAPGLQYVPSMIMTDNLSCYGVARRELLRTPRPLSGAFRSDLAPGNDIGTAAVNHRNDPALGVALSYRTPPPVPQL